MAGWSTRRELGVARLLVVCGVLLGVLLMHGSPATAASGCHDTMTVSTSMPGESTADMILGNAPAVHAAGATHVADQAAMGGASCLATVMRGGPHLPLPGLLCFAVALAAGVLLARPGRPVDCGRRGPPGGGRSLLLRVCVART